jgi:hypothetical protein
MVDESMSRVALIQHLTAVRDACYFVISRSCMSQVSIFGRVTVEALPGHRGALCACRCFLARWSWAVGPRSFNGAALAVLIGNRVGGRAWVTGSFDDPGSRASPRRSDTARYPSLVIPCPLKRSQENVHKTASSVVPDDSCAGGGDGSGR